LRWKVGLHRECPAGSKLWWLVPVSYFTTEVSVKAATLVGSSRNCKVLDAVVEDTLCPTNSTRNSLSYLVIFQKK
jgi:hypothetical protein